jgi:glycosyltransferase involved in cell wall biosynthesis
MSILRDGFDWTFVAPSSAASDNVMSGSTRLKNPPVVMPHGRIVFNPGQTLDHTYIDRLRVAFVGHPTEHKGWDVFKQLAKSCHRRADSVDFFHFGATSDEHPLIDFVETRQTFDTNGLTTRLLMDKGVHAVVAWSSWPETFNIVCYEAMAAGCVIICPENSGNVLFASRQYGRDVCYSNERDLIDDERFVQRIITKLGEETQQGCFEYEGTSTGFFVGGSL